MLQPQVPSPEIPTPDRRATPSRLAPPATVLELSCAEDFGRLAQRHWVRSQRDRQAFAALVLQVKCDSDPANAPDPAARLQLLADCAGRLRRRVRAIDVVARWHGEFFGVLLPRCDAVQAGPVLARLVCISGGGLLRGVPIHLKLQGRVLDEPAV